MPAEMNPESTDSGLLIRSKGGRVQTSGILEHLTKHRKGWSCYRAVGEVWNLGKFK